MISKLLLFFYSLCDPLRLEKDSMREEVHSTYSEPYTLTSSSLSSLSSLSLSLSLSMLVSFTSSLSSLSSGSLLILLQLSQMNHDYPNKDNKILVTLEKEKEIERELEEMSELGEMVKNKNAIKNKKLFQCFMKDEYVKVDSDYVIDLDSDSDSDEEDYSYFVDFYNENEQL